MSARGNDQKISMAVEQKLANRGVRSPCVVRVSTKNGEVTLTGTVQYAHQKSAAVQAATGVTGVRRVTDQTTVGVKRRFEQFASPASQEVPVPIKIQPAPESHNGSSCPRPAAGL